MPLPLKREAGKYLTGFQLKKSSFLELLSKKAKNMLEFCVFYVMLVSLQHAAEYLHGVSGADVVFICEKICRRKVTQRRKKFNEQRRTQILERR